MTEKFQKVSIYLLHFFAKDVIVMQPNVSDMDTNISEAKTRREKP